MKELDSFTVEEIEEIISSCQQEIHNTPTSDEFPVSPRLLLSLARIALAAKRAEPVTWWTGPEPTPTGELESYHDHETGSHYLPLVVSLSANQITPKLNSPEIPDGWKLVPIELINNLRDAAHFEKAWCADVYGDFIGTGRWKDEYEQLTTTCKAVDELLSPLPAAPESE
ncbi:hypothetical protein [Yersinia enterocolitica]|uniref:hypothetical protein n=1 Tax=Yersinia enterocolitica TaxID=630 RepID=UPI003D7B72F4